MSAPGVRLALLAVLLLTVTLSPVGGRRKKPPAPLPAVVQALKPTGLRISVLDEEAENGVNLVIINANINVPLEPKEMGKSTQTILRAQDGFWTMEDASQQLKPNDIVFYWIYYSTSEGGRNYVGHHVIADLVEPSCKPSITTVNGQPACRGALVFEDNFDTFNKTTWKHHIEFHEEQFNAFVSDEENTFAKDGILHLKPTAITDPVQLSEPLKLEGCTSKRGGEFCERKPFAWQIRPPTRTSMISSTTSFRFGRLEVRAKPAAGDYLFSKFVLLPLANEYGRWPASGDLVVMDIRGNAQWLDSSKTENNGANMIHVRAAVGSCLLVFFYYQTKKLSEGLFTDTFHTYAMTWTPRYVKFEVDGDVFRTIEPPLPDGFAGTNEYKDCDTYWEKGTFMSPFDKEFIVHLNLNVGGFSNFADTDFNGDKKKPWRNWTPRGAVDFWRARDTWLPTWKGDFEIDYIKIYAL